MYPKERDGDGRESSGAEKASWDTSRSPGSRGGVRGGLYPHILAVTGAHCVSQEPVYPWKPEPTSPLLIISKPPHHGEYAGPFWAVQRLCTE